MLRVIRNSSKYGLREEVIIRLMFENGMRLGEVLGLTLEDLPSPYSLTGETSSIIMRNRVTDRLYQRAKSLYQPKTKDDYDTDKYKTEGFAWENIPTTTPLLNKIHEYIDEVLSEVEMSESQNTKLLEFKGRSSYK